MKNLTFHQQISVMVSAYIRSLPLKMHSVVWNALAALLGDSAHLYDFHLVVAASSYAQLQDDLAGIRGLTEYKTKDAVYTPDDVCKYIIGNTMCLGWESAPHATCGEWEALGALSRLSAGKRKKLLFKKTFFDPACGIGEFPLNVMRTKLVILVRSGRGYGDKDVYAIVKTVYGNDVDGRCIDIVKLRMFFEVCRRLQSDRYYIAVAKALNAQFFVTDFALHEGLHGKFDCVIGNLPCLYVGNYERRKERKNRFTDIYANVLKNGILSLKKGGVCGYVVPLTYIYSYRMATARKWVTENTDWQFVLPFSEVYDCLLPRERRPMCIMFAHRGRGKYKLYTARYRYWNEPERRTVLGGGALWENRYARNDFVPKLGNGIQESVYKKVLASGWRNMLDIQCEDGSPLGIISYGRFTVRSFFHPVEDRIGKTFLYGKELPLVHCILHSGLFRIFRDTVGDCHNVTEREMKNFYVPQVSDDRLQAFAALSRKFADTVDRLREKKFAPDAIFEADDTYKAAVDLLDDALAEIYGLTDEELHYVKTCDLLYRVRDDSDDAMSYAEQDEEN